MVAVFDFANIEHPVGAFDNQVDLHPAPIFLMPPAIIFRRDFIYSKSNLDLFNV